MCKKCSWEKALPLLKKLEAYPAAAWAKDFVHAIVVQVEIHRHITNAQLVSVQDIEQKVGIKSRGDYDVQRSGSGDSGKRSGLFR